MPASRPIQIAYLAQPNATLVREWAAHFADLGYGVALIVRAGAEVDPGLDPRIALHQIPPYGGLVAGRLRAPRARLAIRRVLADVRPDVVHVHDLTTGFAWLALLSGFHPYVLSAWGSDVYFYLARSRFGRLQTLFALRAADLVTANSDDLRRRAIAMGARPSRSHRVHQGIELDLFAPGEPDSGLRGRLGLEGRRVLFAPRQIAPLYDHVSTVRALRDLPPDVCLVFTCRDADEQYLDEIRTVARESGVDDRLRFVPSIDHAEMPGYYRLADVVVSVPESDAAAASILEALACGRPVVATALPSPREWLDGVSPDLLVPPRDPQAIAHAVARALSLGPEEARLRAAAGRSEVEARASRDAEMTKMDALYRSLVRRDA